MDIEKLIKETLTAHEHTAPDGDQVLAGARQRIDRRRAVLTRPLAVAAGVAVLTLAAVTVVAVNRSENTQVAAPNNQVQTTEATSTAATDTGIAGLTMPYTLGWLPPGEVEYIARRLNIGASADAPETPLYGGEYMFTVTNDGQVLNVDVQQMRMMPVDQAAFKSGPGNPVTINGQPGVESANSDGPGGYELYVAHPDGGSMYVNISAAPGSTAPTEQLIDIGHQIAQNIQFPGTTTVTPTFGLGDLPDGLQVCAFDVQESFDRVPIEAESSTSYSLGTCTTMPTIHLNTAPQDQPTGTEGEPVQGHATRYADDNGYLRLWVLDAVDGAPIAIAGWVALTDLYAVANSLVLPS